jgi:hypothetical protein
MTLGDHVPEDRLEEYCLGTVPVEELEDFESHLLLCPECRRRLGEAEVYVTTMRRAAAEVAASRLARQKRRREAFRRYAQPFPLAAAAGVAALALVWGFGAPWHGSRPDRPVAAALVLTRGGQAAARPHVPSRRPLRLTLDLAGLPALDSCRVVIVDASGDSVYESAARPEAGRVVLAVPVRLAPGTHWIRVYDPAAPATALREFGLDLD